MYLQLVLLGNADLRQELAHRHALVTLPCDAQTTGAGERLVDMHSFLAAKLGGDVTKTRLRHDAINRCVLEPPGRGRIK